MDGIGFAAAQGLLIPNAGFPPGELGSYFAGAQVAMTSSAEASWYNPAGLARAPESSATAGAHMLDSTQVSTGPSQDSVMRAGPGFFAYAAGPSKRRGYPRFGLGFQLSWPLSHALNTRISNEQQIAVGDVPAELTDGMDLDASFPDGVLLGEQSAGFGVMNTISIGGAVGVGVAEWFRFGVGIGLERVHLLVNNEIQTVYLGSSSSGGPNSLTSNLSATEQIEGQVDRLVLQAGAQLDLSTAITLGMRVRFPSRQLAGVGNVRRSRSSQSSVVLAGTEVIDVENFALVDEEGVDFQLRSPQTVQLGVAMLFDTLAVEFNVLLIDGLGTYEVIPALPAGGLSSQAFEFSAVTDSREPVVRYALGFVVANIAGGSFAAGFASDRSGVSGDGGIFSRIDLVHVSLGYYRTAGAGSFSTGVIYRTGEARSANFRTIGNVEPGETTIELTTVIVGLAGSYIF